LLTKQADRKTGLIAFTGLGNCTPPVAADAVAELGDGSLKPFSWV
jgi:hypothetical protein